MKKLTNSNFYLVLICHLKYLKYFPAATIFYKISVFLLSIYLIKVRFYLYYEDFNLRQSNKDAFEKAIRRNITKWKAIFNKLRLYQNNSIACDKNKST